MAPRHALDHVAASRATRKTWSFLQCQASGLAWPQSFRRFSFQHFLTAGARSIRSHFSFSLDPAFITQATTTCAAAPRDTDADVCFNGNISVSQVKLL
jgi:hypothetical protein